MTELTPYVPVNPVETSQRLALNDPDAVPAVSS